MVELTNERKHQIIDWLRYLGDLHQRVEKEEEAFGKNADAVAFVTACSMEAGRGPVESSRYRWIADELRATIPSLPSTETEGQK